MSLTIGSLCSGYGGLDGAVEAVFGARTVWFAEHEPKAAAVFAAHWPGVPNLHDIKLTHFGRVPKVDILTAGYPCQPFSHAGRRNGTADPRHLWPYISTAVRRVRPRYVVLENVAGHRSLGLDVVLGDLAALGYDVRWTSLRAADIGAPHGRERIFILAAYSDCVGSDRPRIHESSGRRWSESEDRDRRTAAEADRAGSQGRESAAGRHLPDGRAATDTSHDGRDEGWTEGRTESAGIVGGSDAAVRSAVASDAERGGFDGWSHDQERCEVGRATPAGGGSGGVAWGAYEPAIRRWERLTRPAPAPTETGPKGGQRLAPRFVEWMQGLPDGWVCNVPGLTRNDMLRILGNGVVPQQATEALRRLLSVEACEAVA